VRQCLPAGGNIPLKGFEELPFSVSPGAWMGTVVYLRPCLSFFGKSFSKSLSEYGFLGSFQIGFEFL
jgi:hypothetical protein